LRVPIDNIHLDPNNPRLPEDSQGKSGKELLGILYRDFALKELAESMAKNGYFEEEPLVVIPKDIPQDFKNKSHDLLKTDQEFKLFVENPQTQFVVVEGNRRLATAKILLSQELRDKLRIREWPVLSEGEASALSQLPVIPYPEREYVTSYLGVRHVTGVMKWEPYAKARYIAGIMEQGDSIDDIQQKIGDRSSVRRSYTCYRLVEMMEEELEGSTDKAKDRFSYLLLAVGQAPVKDYIGLPRTWSKVDTKLPIPPDKLKNLGHLFSFLFGEGKEKAVISESRDITGKLTDVLRSQDAIDELIETRDLEYAYERSDGEETLVLNKLRNVNRGLEVALGIIHRQRTEQVTQAVRKCRDTLDQILKALED